MHKTVTNIQAIRIFQSISVPKETTVMPNKMSPALHTLPVELVYRILDHIDEMTILLSCRHICTRLNTIIDTYHRYQVTIWDSSIFQKLLSIALILVRITLFLTLNVYVNGITRIYCTPFTWEEQARQWLNRESFGHFHFLSTSHRHSTQLTSPVEESMTKKRNI